jgi:DNA-binding HxlR family transcriptional regulator
MYKIFSLIGKKWNIHILSLVAKWENTFSGIKEALNNLNSSILTQRLDELVREGFIEKHIVSEKPRTIRYGLTPTGKEMMKAMKPLHVFSSKVYAGQK